MPDMPKFAPESSQSPVRPSGLPNHAPAHSSPYRASSTVFSPLSAETLQAHAAAQAWSITPHTIARLRAQVVSLGLGAVVRQAYEAGYLDGLTHANDEEW